MLSSWLERQARIQGKAHARAAKQGNARPPSPAVPAQAQGRARKKAHTTRAAKQGNARPPSPAVPRKQLGMMIAFKGSPSVGGLLMPDDASDASDNESLGAASSSRPPSVSRNSPAKQPSAYEVCPGPFVIGLQTRWVPKR